MQLGSSFRDSIQLDYSPNQTAIEIRKQLREKGTAIIYFSEYPMLNQTDMAILKKKYRVDILSHGICVYPKPSRCLIQ